MDTIEVQPYEEPVLTDWGSLLELTAGNAGGPGDDLATGTLT
ncbi:MAG: hypothetical protein NT029_22380 [Armatimonadetes bacterium]|nr:hypothetical protein [Armatimonadota bacterium]